MKKHTNLSSNSRITQSASVLDIAGLNALIRALADQKYTVVGPVLGDGAIVYDEITGVDDLPVGWTDEQGAGYYRLARRDDDAVFGYNVGPQSWKKFFTPEQVRLWQSHRDADGVHIIATDETFPRYALIGVRSCELQAIAVQDRVYGDIPGGDPVYGPRRNNAFIVAVNCGQAGGTCFCTSMGNGPEAGEGYDLVLTELLEDGVHRFLLEAGSDRGRALLADLDGQEASAADHKAARKAIDHARNTMGRTLKTEGLKQTLQENPDHPHWQEVADRCLTCANCTMVCPTCFCSTVEDRSDLEGDHAERWRRWDSCFTMDFSYLHGGSVRSSAKARYRQWMTHKLANWVDQFDMSGCVGCGRCITWCPVGIDITVEAQALSQDDANKDKGAT